MRLSKEDLLAKVKSYIGEDTSEEAVSLLEDIDDSIIESDGEDWEKKYNELNEQWKQKYIERFGSGEPESDCNKDDESKEEKEDSGEEKTFDDLFEKGDEK